METKNKIKQLEKQVKQLEQEKKALVDENESLWFLLDEIKKSNIFNPKHHEQLKTLLKKLRRASVFFTNKKGEA